MIRINLLGVERSLKGKKAPTFDVGQRLTVACSLIVVVAALGIGWWYWSLNEATTRAEADIANATQEAARLKSLLTEVQQFEAQRGQLQQRVQLIEQLRGGQSVPVQLLDHVSRSLPDMLWLTSMVQDGPAVTIEGRSTTLVSLSDFVGNLGSNALLQKPIEIVDSQVEAAGAGQPGQQALETIKFTVKAQLAGLARAGGPGGRGGAAPAGK
ncbi:MAG TPA: PilN domain-containing protein [Vicinamibacterales bacterium]|nr:PilN domain-containing protein [Vicinamibacterales bacterium]